MMHATARAGCAHALTVVLVCGTFDATTSQAKPRDVPGIARVTWV